MTNSKHTKRALLSSVITLILCCSMLVGTTFAWFTDSVESMNNVITAGNLDVEVTQNNTDIREIELFDDILWEPGVVAYENITVENVGTLALQYDLFINFGEQNYVVDAQGNLTEYDLSDVLQVAIVPEGVNESNRDTLTGSIADWALLKELKAEGKLYPVGNADQFASVESFGIVIWWKPGAEDNNWNVQNGKSTTDGEPLHINLGVNVYAQQLSYEEDSFDQWYDLQANTPDAVVNVMNPQVIHATWGMGGSDVNIDNTGGLPLNCIYQFLPTQTQDEALASGYGYWHADFVVTVDRDITEGQAAVAGYYSAFCDDYNDTKWVALSADLPANTPVRLVEAMGNGAITVNYNELCYYSFLDTNTADGFWCGAWADEYLDGMTLTVELRVYETEGDPLDPNGPKNIETGNYITVATYTHTFSQQVNTLAELQAEIDAAQNGTVITLGADIVGDVTVTQKSDVAFTIDGNGHNFAGVITVDGKSSGYETAGVTIKNIKFVADSISADACIRLGHVNAARYTRNVTVEGCLFNVPGAVAVKSYTGGDKNLTIKDCFVTSRCHSLAQLANVEKGLVISGCDVYSKNGINLNNTLTAEITDCVLDVKGYAVRFGSNGSVNADQKTFTIKDCSLKAGCEDGDAVIMFRATSQNAVLNLIDTTVEGATPVKGNTTETVINGLN